MDVMHEVFFLTISVFGLWVYIEEALLYRKNDLIAIRVATELKSLRDVSFRGFVVRKML